MHRLWLTFALVSLPLIHAPAETRPLLVGGHAHGAANIEILHDLGLGNFVWIPKLKYSMGNVPWSLDPNGPHGIYADVDAAVERGLYFAVSQRRGLGEIWRPGGGEYGGDCWGGDLHEPATIEGIQQRAGHLFAGLHAEELDADFMQSAVRLGFRTRIPHLYNFTDRAGGRAAFEQELARIGAKYASYGDGADYWPNLCVSLHHSGFRVGADLVFAELLESLPATELQLAYLRGGGRQFQRQWGVWVSPWYRGQVPCEDKGLWPAAPAVVGGGHPPSAFRRCLYLSYLSGARVLTVQETEPLFSRAEPGNPEAGYKLAPWGEELKSFWDYAKQHPVPPEPIVPLAVLVDPDNGWMPGNLHGGWIEEEMVWAKLPTDRGDEMLARYLDVLLPGFRRDRPDAWTPGQGYPGYFTSTPIGAFDIVAGDIDAAQLAAYPHVMLLGDINMTPELLATLRAYVAQGGNLFVNVHQMRLNEEFVQDEELLGAVIGGTTIHSSWAGGTIIGRQVFMSTEIRALQPLPGVTPQTYTEPWYALQDVQPGTAQVMADDGAGNPVLLRNAHGEGFAYLSSAEYMLNGTRKDPQRLGYFERLLRGLTNTGPVSVTRPGDAEPAKDVSWVAARRDHAVVVLLVNHGQQSVEAETHWREPGRLGILESGGGQLLETREDEDATIFRVRIPAEDVAVLRISEDVAVLEGR